jgi:hypothetical protein
MASKSDLRELGDKYSVKAAMVILSKSKEKLLKKTELEECLKISTVAKHLQNISVDDSIVNKEACFKTIFNLCQKFKLKLDTLNEYLDFIFAKVNGKYPHLDVVNSLSNSEEDFDENIQLFAELIAMDESVFTSSQSSSQEKSSKLSSSLESAAEKTSTATATSTSTSTSTSTLKAPTKAEKETSSTRTSTSTVSAPVKRITLTSSILKVNLQEGENVYLKGGEINYAKYKESDLAKIYNINAKLFIVDIDTCKDTIYPVAIDLSPNSTIKEVLAYIGKVLKDAASKSLKCHTDLHVYKISNLMENDRVTYLSLKQ